MRRNQWTAILLAILLLLFGFVSGLLTHRFFANSVVSAKTAEDLRHNYTDEMKAKLKLDGTQVAKLEVILDETKARFKAIHDENRPAVQKVRADQIAKVKAILRSDQIPEYERLIADRERRFHEQENRDRAADEKRAAEHRAALGQ